MRKISLLLLTMLMWVTFSCKNSDWEFPDFDYTTTYFPYQYPIRTLVLGDYVYDNTDDKALKFKISARMGGVYENKSNRVVEYVVVDSLVNKLSTAANTFDGKTANSPDTLVALPASYYTLAPAGQFDISKGSFTGGVEVQLTDAFLDDPWAAKTKYVIPLKITSSTTDSVLQGKTVIPGADPRVSGQWITSPKNFTIFGIKFVNAYHGKYLHRGISYITDTVTTLPVDTIAYRQKYVEKDELWSLQTIGRNTVKVSGIQLRKSPTSPGTFNINMTFDTNNNCVVTTGAGSAYTVTGTGKFVTDGDMWGNMPQDAIHLNYIVREGNNQHVITDTLVFRDKGVTYQEYTPVILP